MSDDIDKNTPLDIEGIGDQEELTNVDYIDGYRDGYIGGLEAGIARGMEIGASESFFRIRRYLLENHYDAEIEELIKFMEGRD